MGGLGDWSDHDKVSRVMPTVDAEEKHNRWNVHSVGFHLVVRWSKMRYKAGTRIEHAVVSPGLAGSGTWSSGQIRPPCRDPIVMVRGRPSRFAYSERNHAATRLVMTPWQMLTSEGMRVGWPLTVE